MRVGVHAPQLGRAVTPALMVEIARMAEGLGFADLWFSDHVAVPVGHGMPAFFPEPVPLMAAVASHTERIGLGTSVLVPAYRNPMQFAKQWATLDWLAPGRTILGVGAGWLPEEFAACGVDFARRGARLDDYIRGWRRLWSGESEHAGDHFAFSGVRVKPQPAAPIPVWVGGSSPGALRRAAWCDGWHGTWAPVDVFATHLATLRDEMAALGRPSDAVTISMHMEVRVGDAAPTAGYWSEAGDHHGEGDVQAGTPEELVEALTAYDEAGLEHVCLTPQCHTAEEWRDHVAQLGRVVTALG